MNKTTEIKKITLDDSERLWSLSSKDPFYKWTLTNAPYFNEFKQLSYEEFVKNEHQFYIDNDNVQGMYVNNILIGTVNRYWNDKNTRWMEVGIVIFDENYWGKGYATIFLNKWIQRTFDHFELERIGLTTWSGNPGMIKVAKKLGMTQDRTVRYARFYNNIYYDSIGFGITRSEWYSLYRSDIEFESISDLALKSQYCELVLRQLPEWFGIEASTQEYIDNVKDTVFVVAKHQNQCIGFISLKTHESETDEIFVMGVIPSFHRNGVGKSLLLHALASSRTRGKQMMLVKTLSEKVENKEYAITRKYYESQGFVKIHEDLSIWGANAPCFIMALSIN